MAIVTYLGIDRSWGNPATWSGGAIPVDADDVRVPETTGTTLDMDLDRTGDSGGDGLHLNSIYVHEGFGPNSRGVGGNIGSDGNPLKCTVQNADTLKPSILARGSGSFYFKSETGTGGHETGTIVVNSRNLDNGLILDGHTAVLGFVNVNGKTILIANNIGFSIGNSYILGGKWQLNETVFPVSIVSVNITGGEIAGLVNMTYLSIAGGVVEIGGTAIVSGYIKITGGLCIWNSTGLLATLNVMGGIVDTQRTTAVKTITSLYKWPTGTLRRGPQLVVTNEYDIFDIIEE